MKAVIYTRVSSRAQADEGFSLEAQHEKLLKYIDEHNMDLIRVYTDPGVSAKSLKRPGIQEMIADLKAGKFEALIIHKLDRLTRNIADLCDLVDMVVKHNVKLISLSEQLETSTPMGLMFIRMLGVLAQMFRENLAEEIVKGQSMRASKGLRISPMRPYGYDVGENQLMSVNEEEADVVRRMFDLFISGCNFGEICTELADVPAMFGGVWNPNVVGRILANPTYIGTNHWKRKADPEEKRIMAANAHEAIVTEDIFNAAQDILFARKNHFLSQSSADFCFSAVVKCGICGRSFSGRSRNERGYKMRDYRCGGKGRLGCKAAYIAEKKLTRLFLDYIAEFKFYTEEPQKILEGRDLAKEKKRIEKQLADSALAKKNYGRAMGSGKMDYDLYSELTEEENRKTEKLQQELDVINEATPSDKKTRKDYITKLGNLNAEWPAMSERQRKMAISNLFSYIVIVNDGVWRVIGSKMNNL